MAPPHKLVVDQTFSFDLSETDVKALDVVDLDNDAAHIIHNGSGFTVKLLEVDRTAKRYTLAVNGARYEVEISNPIDLLIEKMGFELSQTVKTGSVEAPMPGLILEVSVQEGQEVKVGDALLVLEAMKMENVLTAPIDGVVDRITVQKGDAVDKKQVLLHFK